MQVKKILAICMRDESFEDFLNIAKRIHRLDPAIGVLIRADAFHLNEIPLQYKNLPLLTLYLVNPPTILPARGKTLSVKNIGKLEEYKNYVAAGIPIPQAMPYTIGDVVDPAEWGDYVVLKPIQESVGRGVLLMPTASLKNISAETVPDDHLLRTSPYLLQKYIHSGPNAVNTRVLCLLGQPVLSVQVSNTAPIHFPKTFEEGLAHNTVTSNTRVGRHHSLINESDVLDFAAQAFHAHPAFPLQGLDIVREAKTNKLYVLENNSGGNVWTFSRRGSYIRADLGRKALLSQFMAWDRAAEVLVQKTNELAQ